MDFSRLEPKSPLWTKMTPPPLLRPTTCLFRSLWDQPALQAKQVVGRLNPSLTDLTVFQTEKEVVG